ncbi:unannotated protein [freshwater metagenome]|uniref:Unannotated protein n=1 Tax=freshwater metagenome TaxID=449393 RepID=A0A6J7DFC9_9ZZZZ
MLAVSSTTFTLAVLSTSVVNIALPSIRRDLGGGVAGLQWVSNGYTLMLASLLLTMGALCDQRGARRVMLAGLGLFFAGAVAAAAAPSLQVLVCAQLLKGAGGAALIPASLALLSHGYRNQREQAHAVAFVSGLSAIAVAAGPVIAGFVIGAVSWRVIFAIDIIGVLAIAYPVLRHLPETPLGSARHLDLPGQVCAIVCLAALTFGCIRGGQAGWGSVQTVGPLALAAVSGLLFLAVERRGDAPMLPPILLKIRAFNVASACAGLVNFAFYGEVFVLSLYFQEIRGLSPLDTGWVFIALPTSAGISSILAGRLAGRSGARLPGVLGCAIGAGAMLILATIDAQTPYPVIIGGLILMGLGPGLAVPALTAGLVIGVPRPQAGVASATFTASRQVGGLLGVAVLGTLVASGDFIGRMQVTMLLACGALALASVLALLLVSGRKSSGQHQTGASASAAGAGQPGS